jgi:large subunit ribosomal protein L12e
MPPKFDPNAIVTIYIRVRAGTFHNVVLAPKVGPLGLSPKRVGEEIEAATKGWPKIRVWIELTVQNRVVKVRAAPTTSNLIVSALNESGYVHGRKHNGNITLDAVIEITRTVRTRSLAHSFAGTMKEVLGSCVAVGCTVDGQHPREITQKISQGLLLIPAE